MQTDLSSRVRGALIGCAYGDAFGMPTEMMTRELLDRAFPGGVMRLEPSSRLDFFGRQFPAGTVTDDTQNTVLVCQAIVEGQGEFETERYLGLLRRWVARNADRAAMVLGPSTARALRALDDGVPLDQAGRMGTTNGSAMKVGPIGIVYDYRDTVTLVDAVERLCLPTHNTGVAIAGAAAVAGCVSYAVRGGTDFDAMWDVARDMAEAGARRGNQLPGPLLGERLAYMRDLVMRAMPDEVIRQIQDFLGMGFETVQTVPAVLAMVTLGEGDPHRAAVLTANTAGDTDTVAAIACTICGAMNPDFSREKIDLLQRANGLDFDGLAEGLLPFVR
ncbi:ADP-ribosylglycohydrolase family protein [Parafannyhessea umbonata]|uniref:ADP-ribosylglycohydrolase n=1 Tax=Parafannyhessea umbonata TaxID=604330 RepID=A0A1H9QV85_9ACTN|nr:ADP-ribosylglycohydrolase family protein [Parafannyhessea umbonata]SER64307.1 ADP-ribosylglycohydrolase [Parafannyhessea umbonata]